MEYKRASPRTAPRLIIHGGAGNITPANMPPPTYNAYRSALLTVVSKTYTYMTTPLSQDDATTPSSSTAPRLPSALDSAVHAVLQLEDQPLFNAGHGAVFTRDGLNELEASVMVSRGRAKRGVGVTGLRRVRNPILLARAMLLHGDADLSGLSSSSSSTSSTRPAQEEETGLDVPSAQGHTLLHGPTAEVLARKYGLEMVEPSYFFTQKRWDEHIRGLEREHLSSSSSSSSSENGVNASASWAADEYLPQGTVGAVALDSDGVVCVATSTGGMTNKLTGRIGDTPVPGAGFWAEEWVEEGDPTSPTGTGAEGAWDAWRRALSRPGPAVQLSASLRGLLAECFPTPLVYTPVPGSGVVVTTRSFAGSGTGNGDSFMRIDAVRTVAAMARFKPESSESALIGVAGRGGELQKSAGARWGGRGEGEGGIIGIECAVVRDGVDGRVLESRGRVMHDHNCGGMFRAWIDDSGKAVYKLFHDKPGVEGYEGEEGRPEDLRVWCGEKDAALSKLDG